MRLHVWVIGRALVREVERDFEPQVLRLRDQPAEVFERAERGMHGLVAALLCADRPRRADVVRFRDERIVLALALFPADRMDGRKVNHVEAELRDVRKARLAVAQRAVAPRLGRSRAREKLVPRRESRALAIRDERHLERPGRRKAAVGKARGQARECLVERECAQRVGITSGGGAGESAGPFEQALAIRAGGARRRLLEEVRADACRDAQIVEILAPYELGAPGKPCVRPGGDRIAIAADRLERERTAPYVVAERLHLDLAPIAFELGTPAQHDAQRIVAVGEAVCLDGEGIADDALHCETPAVHGRAHRVDDRARAALLRRLSHPLHT